MVLHDYKIDGDYICISKKELEAFRDHYWDVISQHRKNRDSFQVKLAMKYGMLTYQPWDGRFYFEKIKEYEKD